MSPTLLDALSSRLESLHVHKALLHRLPSGIQSDSHPLLPVYLALLCLSVILLQTRKQVYLLLRFAYSCFLAPIGHSAQQKDRLDAFYTSQASIYDATRGRLLKGREEMLRLAAAHLSTQQAGMSARDRQKLIWVDSGGGTGWNIEQMDAFFGLENFHAIFLIDLCE